jgi:hypothetical protein
MNKNRLLHLCDLREEELKNNSEQLRKIVDGVKSGVGWVFTIRSIGHQLIGYTEEERPSWFDKDNSAEYNRESATWIRSTSILGIRDIINV